MIIGFLGKGGSGKTTLATLFTKYLLESGAKNVLALDNDHNMDFKYNLGHEADMNWMGESLEELFEAVQVESTRDIVSVEDEYLFSLTPADKLTSKYSVNLKDKLSLMVSGPHNAEIMYGNMCSHALTTPLKLYLPLLKLNQDEYVVVDEKAGTDGVGTGVTTGFNLAVVVAEATPHGVKSAKQILDMLRFYNTPYAIIINKIKKDSDVEALTAQFKDYIKEHTPVLTLNYDMKYSDLDSSSEVQGEFDKLFKYIKSQADDRRSRTEKRIKMQKEYNENKTK